MERCYDEKSLEKFPTYRNVTVCEEWHNYQNFAQWFKDTFPIDLMGLKMQLDKDLKQKGLEYKVYSKDTCVFIPERLNYFLTNKTSKNTSGFIGVWYSKDRCKWVSRISDYDTSANKTLGYHDTLEEASESYMKARAINSEKAKSYLRSLNYLPEEVIQLIK